MAEEVIKHGMDDVLRSFLLRYGVSEAGAWQFMQEQVVISAEDRHALRVLLWRVAVNRSSDAPEYSEYNYSKVKKWPRR